MMWFSRSVLDCRTRDEDTITETEIYEGVIVYKVQIAASTRKLEPESYNFKGSRSDITREQSTGKWL